METEEKVKIRDISRYFVKKINYYKESVDTDLLYIVFFFGMASLVLVVYMFIAIVLMESSMGVG